MIKKLKANDIIRYLTVIVLGVTVGLILSNGLPGCLTGNCGPGIVYGDAEGNLEYYIPATGETYSIGVKGQNIGGMADIDEDGRQEMLYESKDHFLKHVDADGEVTNMSVRTQMPGGIADLDNEDDLEAVYRSLPGNNLSYVDSQGNKLNTRHLTLAPGGIGDLDDDNQLEISLIYGRDFELAYFNTENRKMVGLNVTAVSIGDVADIDGDGSLDIPYTGPRNKLKYINHEGDLTVLDVKAESVGGVADFDGDGDLDIAYVAYNNTERGTGELQYIDGEGDVSSTGISAVRAGYGTDISSFN